MLSFTYKYTYTRLLTHILYLYIYAICYMLYYTTHPHTHTYPYMHTYIYIYDALVHFINVNRYIFALCIFDNNSLYIWITFIWSNILYIIFADFVLPFSFRNIYSYIFTLTLIYTNCISITNILKCLESLYLFPHFHLHNLYSTTI